MVFVKVLAEIGSGDNSITTSEIFNIAGEFDIDALCGTMTFDLPYLLGTQLNLPDTSVDITKLKKNDTIKLYFGEFPTNPGRVTTDQLNLVFDGFIESINLAKSKDSIPYSFNALGTLGLSNERNVEWEVTSFGDMTATVEEALKRAKLDFLTFESTLAEDSLTPSIEGEKNLKGTLMKLRNKYAVIIHQTGDGVVRLFTPEFLNEQSSTIVYEFDMNLGNVFNVDYGDLTSDINATVVLGFESTVGQAVDAIGIQNRGGVIPDDINYQSFENRDLFSDEECEQVARNKLLEILRDQSITFKTKFDARFQVGQAFTLIDNDRFDGTQRFMIKKYNFTINKQDVSCDITGYTHSLTLLPEDIVLSNTGIADIDVIGLRPKQEDIIGWNAQPF